MRDARNSVAPLASLKRRTPAWRRAVTAGSAIRFTLSLTLILPALTFGVAGAARATEDELAPAGAAKKAPAPAQGGPRGRTQEAPPAGGAVGREYQPTRQPVKSFAPVNVSQLAEQEALAPSQAAPGQLRAISAPAARPEWFENRGKPVGGGDDAISLGPADAPPQVPVPSAQGSSPAPFKSFTGEFLSGTTIPPDTMGAVGTNHIMTVSNNQLNFRTRDGALISRLTLNAFWAGVTLEGGITTPSTFDPKVFYDRFNDRYFFFTSANSVSPASSVLFAVTQTNDPTGTWNRFVFDADPTATGGPTGTGRWADYPTVGFNKNWIVANYNVFNYSGTATTGYSGPYIYVIDKGAAYANTLSTVTLFQDTVANCVAPFNNFLGCGFTMAPAVVEDNTTEENYLVEDWDSVFGQLRVSKLTGTAAAPVLTVGTQFPQSTENWRFNAARIGTTGGYVPQRDQIAYSVSLASRIMANDSRINNSVLRNGSLWASHHAMVGAAPTAPGTPFGVANPDIRTAVQWWEIDPAVEAQPDPMTGLGTPPVQRGRIVDPTADNCNSGNSINNSTERPACTQTGQFFFFAAISVNKDDDMLVGFTQSSPLTYPSGAYAMRRASDPPNTTRDVVVFRSGASNYNIGAGSGAGRQNRWGDYSASQTDPLNDTDFWTNQEYSETRTNFGIGIAAPWATWWALVKPTSTQPTTTGNLIISEFRLRGPGGANDEFVELYNPSTTTPHRVASADNSEGWALAWNNGTVTTPLTVVPQGTVIPPRGSYLIANSPVSTAAGAETLYYSLRNYPGASTIPGTMTGGVRTATADTGYSSVNAATDAIADNAGVALFRSSTPAAFIPANQADAAGFAGAGTTFREGTGIPAITGTPTGQISFHRRQTGATLTSPGAPQDTGDNATDFQFVDTVIETLGVQPALGAPGPQNLDSPVVEPNIGVDRFDVNAAIGSPPNRVRRLCADPLVEECNPSRSALGTLSMRRRVTNYTVAAVSRLRWRITLATTAPAPSTVGTADLRAITSSDITVNGQPVKGTTLEEPPTQTVGGGWNASWSAALPTPLAAGASINVQFLFGVQVGGTFSVLIQTEALP